MASSLRSGCLSEPESAGPVVTEPAAGASTIDGPLCKPHY
jgi:hypothetical protein